MARPQIVLLLAVLVITATVLLIFAPQQDIELYLIERAARSIKSGKAFLQGKNHTSEVSNETATALESHS